MHSPTLNLVELLKVLNFESKRDLEKHCRNLVVHQSDLFAFIISAQHGAFHPYKYANHYFQQLPEDLTLKDSEHEAFRQNGVGVYKTKEARKFASKVFQFPRANRNFAAHLLYTDDFRFWHLFYFDNRDTKKYGNHWKHGPHIHYLSELWSGITLEKAWSQILSRDVNFANKLHIRYEARAGET